MSDVKAIRKHTAQHDLFNRIHSIASDESFVQQVAVEWYQGRFNVVPNQRCGTWYCDPSTSSKAYAYFKSTDGHTNNWNFNLRRSNLPFAEYAEQNGGLILVDSTRRGKRMPDALSKSVPIWCAVVNMVIARRRSPQASSRSASWDTALYLPPNIVSPSERSQIEALLPVWADALDSSTLSLPPLSNPLRPFFIHPATSQPPHIPSDSDFTPIICLSTSRWIGSADDRIPTATRIGSKTVGFEYVPGAGDDDELWARGLKPPEYHSRRADLLSVDRDQLPKLVDDIVQEAKHLTLASLSLDDTASPISTLTAVPSHRSHLAVDLGEPTVTVPWDHQRRSRFTLYVVEVDKVHRDQQVTILPLCTSSSLVVVPNPRTEGAAFVKTLRAVEDLAEKLVIGDTPIALMPARKLDLDQARMHERDAENGFTPSTLSSPLSDVEVIAARKVIIPLAVAILCSLPELDEDTLDFDAVDKSVIADQLHRLVALWPDGNPPRAALRRINEFLMSNDR